MVVSRPPLGWNSWNTFAENINEELILGIADTMVSEGLRDAGYEYLVIDDCWSLRERDKNGKLVADPEKFPHGMKYVADYVHSKGLKFGMYSCCGALTCAGYPGSYQHEYDDAATFAEWGVDFLKYDYCFRDTTVPGEILYRKMGMALANCGRDILFSACNWGADNSQDWIKTTGAHMWRSTQDFFDSWGSIADLTRRQFPLFKTNGQGCFNDMDMMVVGLNGKGNVGRGMQLTDEEYRSHMSVWCLFGSPIMIGCDIRNMTPSAKAILTNREVLAIDQDAAGRQVFTVGDSSTKCFCAARMLDGGDIAIGFFNMDDVPNRKPALLPDLGIDRLSGKTLKLRDVWTGEEIVCKNEIINVKSIAPHDCRLFRGTLVDAE